MMRNLKALGLGVVAVLAMGALLASSALSSDANYTGGHFTNDASDGHVFLTGTEAGTHRTALHYLGQSITCTGITYSGTVDQATETEVTIEANYPECWSGEPTHPGAPNATVHMNGCDYLFTVRQTNASTKHSPVHLKCPKDKKATVITPNCTITFGEQEIKTAVVYKTIVENNKHAITAEITATEIKLEKHGLCEFLSPFGTGPHSGANGGTLTGSVTLTGKDTLNNFVNITATGTNNH